MVFRKYIKKGLKTYFKYMGPNMSGKAFKARTGVVKKLASTVRNIKGMLNVEYKHFDKDTTLSVDTNGLVYHLTNIPEGDDDNQRNGRSVRMKSLYMRGEISINSNYATTAPFPTYYRVIVFMDTENRGSVPAVSDVLQAVDWNSPLNTNNGKQFKVLKDHTYSLDPGNVRSIARKLYFKLNDVLRFQGTGSNITDARNNHLFVLVISNESPLNPTLLPSFKFYSRLRYIDN